MEENLMRTVKICKLMKNTSCVLQFWGILFCKNVVQLSIDYPKPSHPKRWLTIRNKERS